MAVPIPSGWRSSLSGCTAEKFGSQSPAIAEVRAVTRLFLDPLRPEGDSIFARQPNGSFQRTTPFVAILDDTECSKLFADVRFGSRLCGNTLKPRMRRMAFSIAFFRQKLPVQLVSASTKSRRKFYTQVGRQSFH